jgi:hypothetical protein
MYFNMKNTLKINRNYNFQTALYNPTPLTFK